MATLTIARPQTVLQVLKKALNVLAECNVIYEAVPVNKPRTCILPAPRLAECFPESRVLQVLCQRAHRLCIVALIIFDVVRLPTSGTRSHLSQRLLGPPLRCGSCRLSTSSSSTPMRIPRMWAHPAGQRDHRDARTRFVFVLSKRLFRVKQLGASRRMR